MRRFLERALTKIPKMTNEQLRGLVIALSEENGQLDAALDSMLDGIVVCDLSHRPIMFNKSAERILRPGHQDPSDRPLWQSIPDRELAEFFRTSLTQEDTVLGREFGIDSGTGFTRVISASLTPLVARKAIAGTLVHLEDITEKRRREGQLRRAESLASLTTLAAGVAHEIKNQLGSLGVRPMDIQLIESDPSSMIREIAELVRYEAEKMGTELATKIPERTLPVPVDRRYLKQAILNLVNNALAAMPEGGTLGLSLVQSAEETRILVSDTGVGIPEDKLAKIFEPYYTTRENGTGLGLTITFKIVKEHGGEIGVLSRPGQGSTFTITLPMPQKDLKLIGHSDA